ncbi:MAG: NADH-quinone oxidoreductase subunit A [Chitinophagales bacterium]|jgi:NADH-quinone oxidoreductase subunit A|nr:NADH-quinone oxidoreductase subunit A [Chitinophagales bacterium]
MEYLYILILAAISLGFVMLTIFGSNLLGPKKSTKHKDENFECGVESDGDARQPISVKYFIVAILFVLFDVEVIFFYPYAVIFKEMGMQGFVAVLLFVAVFLVGFYYIIKKGILDWNYTSVELKKP